MLFQPLPSLLVSNDGGTVRKWTITCSPKVARKILSKEELSAFILSFVFLQNYSVVLRMKNKMFWWQSQHPANVSHACVPCIHPPPKGTEVGADRAVLCLSPRWWMPLTDLLCVPSLFCPLVDVLQHSRFKWRVHRTAAFVQGQESAEQT